MTTTTRPETTAAEPALRIDDLTKRFDRTTALDRVSLEVPRGSIYGLLGPNGAGKTTLFSLAAGFIHADAGAIRVLGTDIAHVSELQGRMTILPQDAAFQKNVPILEQLVFFRRLDGSPREAAEREVEEALERVGIAEYKHRGIHALSHGMLKRMGIAQAFLGSPEIILLDEPTSGLDPKNAKQIRDLVLGMQRESGVTTVISSHNLDEIQELCDRVAILDEGKLLAAGPVDEITQGGRMLEVDLVRPLDDSELAAVRELTGVGEVAARGPKRYRVEFALGDGVSADDVSIAILRRILDFGVLPKSVAQADSLEETFLRMVGKNAEDD